MSDRIALTEKPKTNLFDRLIAKHVIEWRTGKRLVDGKITDRTFIEHRVNKGIFVVEE